MRPLLTLAAGLILGAVAGAGGMLIAFPYLFPLSIVDEKPPAATASGVPQPVGSFKFDETAPGRDRVHWANGTGTVFSSGAQAIVRLEDDFEAGPGPNYWIYLNTTPVGEEADFLADTKRVKIAPLKSFKRGQNYGLPETIRIGDFETVTIWCESFSAYIASARLPSAK